MSTRTASRSRPGSDRKCAGFLKKESGAYTIFAVIGFGMLMVLIGLVIDIGRLMSIHSQASSYADRIALAAAAELDGNRGALRRAVNAARALPGGERLTLTGDDHQVGVSQLTFLSSLTEDGDPDNPYTRSPVLGDVVVRQWRSGQSRPSQFDPANGDARFVVVTTTQERESYLFFDLFSAVMPETSRSPAIAPQAVAGFREDMCNTAPVMVCNPNEDTTAGRPRPGDTATLTLQGGVNWGRTNFGLLDAEVDASVLGLPINLRLGHLLGRTDPRTACYGNRVRGRGLLGLNLDLGLNIPALSTSIRAGLNQRYDDNNREFPVALVNCRQNRNELIVGGLVPVEAYARVRMTDRIDANLTLNIRFLDPAAPGPSQQKLRRYPVLVR